LLLTLARHRVFKRMGLLLFCLYHSKLEYGCFADAHCAVVHWVGSSLHTPTVVLKCWLFDQTLVQHGVSHVAQLDRPRHVPVGCGCLRLEIMFKLCSSCGTWTCVHQSMLWASIIMMQRALTRPALPQMRVHSPSLSLPLWS
jgi:hypothetical protein